MSAAAQPVMVEHTCANAGYHGSHTAEFTADRVVPLGCGCTRLEGRRCDGTRLHVLVGGCTIHDDDTAEVSS